MKLLTLVNSEQALMRLKAEKLPAKLALRLDRNLRKITPELESFHARKIETAAKYGQEKDGMIRVPPEKMAEFQPEIAAMLDEEVPLELTPIFIHELPESFAISAEDIHLLDYLIQELSM